MGIFWTPDDSTKIEKVTMPWAAETYFIPEGTPMSATGIANNGDAIGILAQDANLRYAYTYGSNPQGKVDFEFSIMTAGFVNLNKAQESFGGEYSDECKSALTNIVFVDDQNPSSFGGGGFPSGLPVPANGGYGWNELNATMLDQTLTYESMESPASFEPFYVSVGEKYTIVIGEDTYENVEAVAVGPFIALGNASGDFSDYPFMIGTSGGVAFFQNPGTYSVKVIKNGETARKIDKKYIPGALMVVNLLYDEDSDSYSVDKSFNEIKSVVPNVIMVSYGEWRVYNLSYYDMNTIEFVDQRFHIHSDESVRSIEVQQIIINHDNSVERLYGAKALE